MDSATIDFLTSDEGRETLIRTLSYHVVPQVLPSVSLTEPVDVVTLTGDGIFVSTSFGDLLINDAVVVTPDVLANNGIVHVIDIVLEPPPPPVTESPTAGPTDDIPVPDHLDLEGCFGDLFEADIDESGAVERDEYLNFINLYVERLCASPQDELSPEQQSAFIALACTCREEEGSDPSCCLVDNAALSTTNALNPSDRTEEQQNFLTLVCVVTDSTLQNLCPTPAPTPTAPPPAPTETIYQVVVDNGWALVFLILAAGLDDALGDPDASLTFFAPIDQAIDSLPSRTLQYLRDNQLKLASLLLGHVLAIKATASDVLDLAGTGVTFLNGVNQTINVNDDGVFIGSARVLETDIAASNGIIHVIDSVLGIPTFGELLAQGDDPLFSLIRSVLEAVSMPLEIADDRTVFVPTTQAFLDMAAVHPFLSISISTNPEWQLHVEELLRTHIVDGVLFAEDFVDGTTLSALNGNTLSVSVSDTGVALGPSSSPAGVAAVITPDVITTRSVVHVVDGVVTPTFLTRDILALLGGNTLTFLSLVLSSGFDATIENAYGITGTLFCTKPQAQPAQRENRLYCSSCFYLYYGSLCSVRDSVRRP